MIISSGLFEQHYSIGAFVIARLAADMYATIIADFARSMHATIITDFTGAVDAMIIPRFGVSAAAARRGAAARVS